ncbi:DUF945 family protein [Alteromonas gilva]|uniref:DUF945 family protein n=1 Tax=Alteromonas gilva TaxID=2987522 RepID=A0ABT5KZ97_9ALTE|nr:DUF945 family protein [Alteromonas gilva]MDC8830085.1 DUF945 family protein [Alteromonas gilva]
MKKILLALLLFVVVIGLVGPKFAGNAFNQQLDDFADKLSEQPFYKATVEERVQSWFSTTASLAISIDIAQYGNSLNTTEQAVLSFSVPIKAQHGPLLTQSDLRLGVVDWQVNIALAEHVAQLKMAGDSEFIYSAEGFTSLLGTTSYSDIIPALTYTEPQSGFTLSITGWQGHARLTSDSMEYKTEQPLSLKLATQDTPIASFDNMSFDADLASGFMQAWKQPLYNGEASLRIDTITMANLATSEETKIENIVVDSVTSYDDTTELGSMLISSRVTSFVSSAMAIKDIQLDVEVANLQRNFLTAYQQLSEDIMNAPDQTESLFREFIQSAGLAQLQASPELNFPVIKGVINESKINGYANTRLVNIQTLPDTMEDPAFWAEHAFIDATLNAEEGAALFIAELILKSQLGANPQFAQMSDEEQKALIAEQSQATINAFVQQGMLSKTDAGYEITFSMENANAILNGQPMGLPF